MPDHLSGAEAEDKKAVGDVGAGRSDVPVPRRRYGGARHRRSHPPVQCSRALAEREKVPFPQPEDVPVVKASENAHVRKEGLQTDIAIS
jgi:hypothetical protein